MKRISKLLLFITILFLPLYVIRGDTFPTTFLELLAILTFLVWVLERFIEKDFSLKSFRTPFNLSIFLFLAISVFESFVSPDLMGGLGILRAYFWEPVLIFFLTVWWIRKDGYKFLIYAFLSCAFLVSFVSIIQATTGYLVFSTVESSLGRSTSFFNTANAVGLLIAPVFVLCFPFFLQFKKDYFHLFVSLCLFSSFIAIFLTKSRGTLISLLAALIFCLAVYVFRRFFFFKKNIVVLPFLLTIFPLILAGVFYIFLANYNLTPPVDDYAYRGTDTLQIRFYLWKGTFQMLFDHPLLGAGLNGFKSVYSGDYVLPQYIEALQYPHNLWLTIYSETGFFGMLVFLYIFYLGFRLIFGFFEKNKSKIFNKDDFLDSFALPLGLLGAILYVQLHGLVDVPYFKNDLAVQFWVFMGLVSTLDS
jgi:O-antigen ligase